MLKVRNKALPRCLGFLTRAVQVSRGSVVAAQKEGQMKLLLLHRNVLMSIFHLIGTPQIDAKVRVAVASLMLKLVRLPTGLHDTLAEAYEVDDASADRLDDGGVSSSTNRTLFSSDAAELHGRAEWLGRVTDLACDLRDAVDSIQLPQSASPDHIDQLSNGMVLTATASHNLEM